MYRSVAIVILSLSTFSCRDSKTADPSISVAPPAPEQRDENGELIPPGAVVNKVATAKISCPANWTLVSADKDYQTPEFCIMKYEAREVSGRASSQPEDLPRVSLPTSEAKTTCAALGGSYALINNAEWMSVASSIAQNSANWYGDRGTGLGYGKQGESITAAGVLNSKLVMIRGHADANPPSICDSTQEMVDTDCSNSGKESDPTEKRVFKLLGGGEVWDLSGNVWEWIDYENLDAKPYSLADGKPVAAYREFAAIDGGLDKMPKSELVPHKKSYWVNSWNSGLGIGGYFAAGNGEGGALMRGGFWNDKGSSGIFFADLARPVGSVDVYIGYRCVKRK